MDTARWVRRLGRSRTAIAFALLLAVVAPATGAATATYVEVAIALSLAVPMLLLIVRGTPAAWVLVIVGLAIAGRALSVSLGIPRIVEFAHYPVTAAFLITATVRGSERRRTNAGRGLVALLGAASYLLFVASVRNTHPLRAVIFGAILLQPFAIYIALRLWPPAEGQRQRAILGFAILLAVQFPLAVWQALTIGAWDPVQGTIVGHGAGAHILGAIAWLGIFFLMPSLAGKRPAKGLILVIAIGLLVGLSLLAGALQVIVAASAVLAATTLYRLARALLDRRISRRQLISAILFSVASALSLFGIRVAVPNIFRRVGALIAPEQIPLVSEVLERSETPLRLLFGSGPGVGASRASILLTPTMAKQSSPLSAFGLPPTEEGLKYVSRAVLAGGGSAESVVSSYLSLLVDTGLFGLLAVLLAGLLIWKQAGRARNLGLAYAARYGLAMTGILCGIDLWLEYPEYAIPLFAVLGLAAADASNSRHPVAQLERHSAPSSTRLSRGLESTRRGGDMHGGCRNRESVSAGSD